MNWYIGVLIGIGAAAVRVGLGWMRSQETWDTVKALRTLGIGIVEGGMIGGLAGLDAKATFVAVFGGTIVLEEVLVGAYRVVKG